MKVKDNKKFKKEKISLQKTKGFEPDSKMRTKSAKRNVSKIKKALDRGDDVGNIFVRKRKGGGHEVLDGHHRVHAHRQRGDKHIHAVVVPPENITEGKYPPRMKGWGNAKTGNLVLTPIRGKYRPYHQEFASNNLRKLGLQEKDAIKHIDNSYQPPKEDDAEKLFRNIQSGKIDRDKAFEEFLNKNGWHSIVIDDGTYSIGDYKGGLRKYHKIAVAIDKKFGADSMFQDSSDFFEVGTEDINNKYDWNNYIKTKKVGGRTEIGRTMAQFREELHEGALMSLIKKHDNPLAFLADAMAALASGDLKLKERGVANTRELVHAWNEVKKRKIRI